MNYRFLRYLNWGIFAFLFLIFIYSLLVYFNIVAKDFFIFNMEFFGKFYQRAIQYVLILSVLKMIFAYVSRKHKYKELELAFLFISLPFLIDALGNLFGWYTIGNSYSIVWYDNLSHFLGAFFVALGIFNIGKVAFRTSSLILIAICAFGVSFAIGTLFGVSEYYSDLWIKTAMVGGLVDSITDNVYDFSGSFTAMLLLFVLIKSNFIMPAKEISLEQKE